MQLLLPGYCYTKQYASEKYNYLESLLHRCYNACILNSYMAMKEISRPGKVLLREEQLRL